MEKRSSKNKRHNQAETLFYESKKSTEEPTTIDNTYWINDAILLSQLDAVRYQLSFSYVRCLVTSCCSCHFNRFCQERDGDPPHTIHPFQ